MRTYTQKTTRTRLITRRMSRLTLVLVSVSATLLLGSSLLLIGQEQDSAPIVSQTSPSMVESQEPIKIDEKNTATPEVVAKYSSYEVTLVAKTVWGEARGCSRDEQKLVVWCICNRADARNQSVEEVVTATNQFVGYDHDHPVEPEIVELVEEVLQAWSCNEEALILPPYATTSNYQYFSGDGKHNWFREEY